MRLVPIIYGRLSCRVTTIQHTWTGPSTSTDSFVLQYLLPAQNSLRRNSLGIASYYNARYHVQVVWNKNEVITETRYMAFHSADKGCVDWDTFKMPPSHSLTQPPINQQMSHQNLKGSTQLTVSCSDLLFEFKAINYTKREVSFIAEQSTTAFIAHKACICRDVPWHMQCQRSAIKSPPQIEYLVPCIYTTQTNEMQNFLNSCFISDVSCMLRTSWVNPKEDRLYMQSGMFYKHRCG